MNWLRHMQSLDSSLEVQELQGQFPTRDAEPLRGRDARVGAALAVVFGAVATAMAVFLSHSELPVLTAVTLVIAYAVASSVAFDISAGYTVPTQLVFVPMLFLLPIGLVPLFVLAGFVLGSLPTILTRRLHPTRLILCAWDSWHSIGPALVLFLAGVDGIDIADWPFFLGALAAQFAFDFVGGTVHNRLAHGIRPTLQLGPLTWVYLGDALLAPVGFAATLASVHASWAFLLVLPLIALLAVFARERKSRIAHAQELSQAYRGTAMLLGDVVEADDLYTGEHSKGVVELALAVADELGLDATQRRKVEFGALLHDVGKVSIPKEIINKPAALTPEEREVINTHTIEGQRMLDRVGGVLGEVGVIVRASHEDYDGGGYPDGLVGESIPIEARIVSCCDAFSAMTTDRPYRKALSLSQAFAELQEHAGTQFDPVVVATLMRICGWHPREGAPRNPAVRTEIPSAPVSL